MRISKYLFLFVFTLFMANTSNASDPTKSTSSEIQHLLQKDFSDLVIDASTKVAITFMVTDKHELVVLSTNEKMLDEAIKSALNYKVIDTDDLEIGKKYTLPVVLRKK